VPYAATQTAHEIGIICVVRILRTLRLFNVLQHTAWIKVTMPADAAPPRPRTFAMVTQPACSCCYAQLLSGALEVSFIPLLISFFVTTIAVLFFGCLLYFVERGTFNETSGVYESSVGHRRCG
jgi:hypothetical protein